MAMCKCQICKGDLLSEADPYMVIPRHDGYHVVCLECFATESDSPFTAKGIYQILNSKIPKKEA